jgi:hypothetical protein
MAKIICKGMAPPDHPIYQEAKEKEKPAPRPRPKKPQGRRSGNR